MKSIPLPGRISNLDRQNLEVSEASVEQFVYFKFNPDQYKKSKLIVTIPANHIIHDWFIVVTEAFNGSGTQLLIGSTQDSQLLMNNAITIAGTHAWATGFTSSGISVIGKTITKPLSLYASIRIEPSTGRPPDIGLGYGVIKYLNLELVPGFGRLL